MTRRPSLTSTRMPNSRAPAPQRRRMLFPFLLPCCYSLGLPCLLFVARCENQWQDTARRIRDPLALVENLAEAELSGRLVARSSRHETPFVEVFNSLLKTDLSCNRGPRKGINDLEFAVAEFIGWFNMRRRQGGIGLISLYRKRTPSRQLEPNRQMQLENPSFQYTLGRFMLLDLSSRSSSDETAQRLKSGPKSTHTMFLRDRVQPSRYSA